MKGKSRNKSEMVFREEPAQCINHVIQGMTITQKQNLENLKTRGDLFCLLLENSHEVFWVRDYVTRQIEYISPAYELVWGRTCQSAFDHPESFVESVYPEDKRRITEAIKNQYNGKPFNEQYRIIGPGGEIRWVWVRTYLVGGENGLTSCIVGIAEDVTEQIKAEETLRTLNIELELHITERIKLLEKSNKELETYAYSVSHDLRAPLRRIDGYSQILLEDHSSELNDEIIGCIYKIRKASMQMSELIESFLRLSKISFAEIFIEDVDLSNIANEIIVGLEDSCHKGHPVTCIIQPEIIVKGDYALLNIAFDNLLSNAWKFTAKKKEAKIEVGVIGNKHPVYFVRDNGVGFDSSKATRLFEPFQRMHTQKDYQGTGIGLTIVKRIIERHGGNIWVESRVGIGTVIYFTLGVETNI